MKNWFKHPYFIILLIIGAAAIFYYDSFWSAFYREDRFFLDIIIPRDLFVAVSDVHYHPISLQLFYVFGRTYFKSNLFLYHLVLYLYYAASLFFIFEVTQQIIKSKVKSLIVVFLYAFNISFFAIFYWVAVSYFALGSFFFFGSIWLFMKKKSWAAWILPLNILLALGSNEATVSLFAIFFLISWYQNYFPKRLITSTILGIIFLIFRFFILKLPTAHHYLLHIDLRIFKTWEWFIWRGFNLPEGIRFSGDPWLYVLFFLSFFIFALSVFLQLRNKNLNLKLLIFGGTWFTFGLAPFLLLPQHMSAYYVLFGFFGFALPLVDILWTKKILLSIFLLVYFVLSVRGLFFLQRTHYIILKNVGWPGKFSNVDYYPPKPPR